MRDHGLHDLRPVRHRAKHVRHIAARLHEMVVDGADFGINLGTIKARDSGHSNLNMGRDDPRPVNRLCYALNDWTAAASSSRISKTVYSLVICSRSCTF